MMTTRPIVETMAWHNEPPPTRTNEEGEGDMADDDTSPTRSEAPSSHGAGQRRRQNLVHLIDPEAATKDDVSGWAAALVDEAAGNRAAKESDESRD